MPAHDHIKTAVAAIILAVFALSFGDALIKRFSVEVSLWQIFIMRSALALPVVWLMMKTAPIATALAATEQRGVTTKHRGVTTKHRGTTTVALLPRNPGWTLLRSALVAFMMIAFQSSLPYLPLSTAAAGLYTLPLFITLFTALFSGERVRASGWLAIGIGFAGMLLILRPQTGAFNTYALLPIVSAVLYALVMMLTRTRCVDEHPLSLAFHALIAYTIVGAAMLLFLPWLALPIETNPFLLSGWRAPHATDWVVMALLAVVMLVGLTCGAMAYQRAPPPIIAAFDFSYLPFAALWSIVFFSEFPDAVTLFGMLLITVGGMLALRR